MISPQEILFSANEALPQIAVVDHYCGTETFMRKALALQAQLGPVFDVTFDCEDGASAGDEIAHAEMVAELLNSLPDYALDSPTGVGVRVHDVMHPGFSKELDIILAQAGNKLAYLTLPKVRGVQDVTIALKTIRALEKQFALNRQIPLHVLIETHGAVNEVWQIAALEGVRSLDFGLMDFVSEHLGALHESTMRSPAQFTHHLIIDAKCKILAGALAHRKIPTHNVCVDLSSPQAAYEDAKRARELGFLRMWSIHPSQITPIIQAMSPTQDEVSRAEAILLYAQEHQWGAIRFENKLHDRASYRYYWNILRRAHHSQVVSGVQISPKAQAAFFNT